MKWLLNSQATAEIDPVPENWSGFKNTIGPIARKDSGGAVDEASAVSRLLNATCLLEIMAK